jgi:hypothetical protein
MEFSAEAGSHPTVLPSQERQQYSSPGTSSGVAYLKLQRHGRVGMFGHQVSRGCCLGTSQFISGGGVTPRQTTPTAPAGAEQEWVCVAVALWAVLWVVSAQWPWCGSSPSRRTLPR